MRGLRDGYYYIYHSSGKVGEETHYTQGFMDGKKIVYDAEQNKLAEQTYKMGKLDGVSIKYSPPVGNSPIGYKLEQANYKDGKLHGEYIKWANAKIDMKGNYENGKKTCFQKLNFPTIPIPNLANVNKRHI